MKDYYKDYNSYKKLLYEAYKNVPHAADGSVSNADLENYMVEHLPEELSEASRRQAVKAFRRDYDAEADRIMDGCSPTDRIMADCSPFYLQWYEEQKSKGRPESELTFGNFAEEWAIPHGLMRRVQ